MEEDEISDKKYASTKREYFNSKKNNFKVKADKDRRTNDANSFTVKRNRDDNAVNNTMSAALTRGVGNPSTSAFSSWGANASKMYHTNKDRPDVSYLQTKNSKMAVSKNMLFTESTNQAIISQSQLTSGNEGIDDYM